MNRIALNSTEIAPAADGTAPEWVELIPAADTNESIAGRDGRAWHNGAAVLVLEQGYTEHTHRP